MTHKLYDKDGNELQDVHVMPIGGMMRVSMMHMDAAAKLNDVETAFRRPGHRTLTGQADEIIADPEVAYNERTTRMSDAWRDGAAPAPQGAMSSAQAFEARCRRLEDAYKGARG